MHNIDDKNAHLNGLKLNWFGLIEINKRKNVKIAKCAGELSILSKKKFFSEFILYLIFSRFNDVLLFFFFSSLYNIGFVLR